MRTPEGLPSQAQPGVNEVEVYEYDQLLGTVSFDPDKGLVVKGNDQLKEFIEGIMTKQHWKASETVERLPGYLTGVVHAQVKNNGEQDGAD